MNCPMCNGMVMSFMMNQISEDFKCIECKCIFTVFYSEIFEEEFCHDDCDKCGFYEKCTFEEKDYDIGNMSVEAYKRVMKG